ncbi:hypothetical protein B0H11DRAFT_1900169 [Mycena galericulata]|nr:hypothetical protein B0H11DRAFT_1900169 [Mycena galericulata]
MTTIQRRLFGRNRPHINTNARHCAMLRKSLECFSDQYLDAKFDRPTHLRVVMGTADGFFQLGKITSNVMRDGRIVFRETDIPDAEARHALLAYRDAYDACFPKRGNDYRARDPQAIEAMQAAEQRWHIFILRYRLARNMGGRPDWALEPLPGLERVRVAPEPRAPKRKFLGVVDISDDDEALRPRKKFLGFVDLTN